MPDWIIVVATSLLAGVTAALVQPVATGLPNARQRNAYAAYMAMRLAVILEAYGAQCSDFIDDNSSAETRPDTEYPDWSLSLPELPAYPDDADGWRAIERRLAGQALGLKNKLARSQATIRATWEYAEDDLGFVLDREAGKLGMEALAIAADLRRTHGVENGDSIDYWRDRLKNAADKAEKELASQESIFLPGELEAPN